MSVCLSKNKPGSEVPPCCDLLLAKLVGSEDTIPIYIRTASGAGALGGGG